jgi:V/A-type H+-transporting ATPase subunit F
MSHAVHVLARPQVASGFRLAGVRSDEVLDIPEGVARMRELLRDPAAGVVLLEDSLYDALPSALRAELGRRPLPMVVPVPGPEWGERRTAAESYIVELLRQVIGYRVRLR